MDFNIESSDEHTSHSDKGFKAHSGSVLDPPPAPGVASLDGVDVTVEVTITDLDGPISPAQVRQQVRKMKADKACGPDRLPPGVFSLLPTQWIFTIAILFNNIFFSDQHLSGVSTKVSTIFKKGDRMNPHNYRGISVLNCNSKFYDMALCERLVCWFQPFRGNSRERRNTKAAWST